jgi:hypothetical protein
MTNEQRLKRESSSKTVNTNIKKETTNVRTKKKESVVII